MHSVAFTMTTMPRRRRSSHQRKDRSGDGTKWSGSTARSARCSPYELMGRCRVRRADRNWLNVSLSVSSALDWAAERRWDVPQPWWETVGVAFEVTPATFYRCTANDSRKSARTVSTPIPRTEKAAAASNNGATALMCCSRWSRGRCRAVATERCQCGGSKQRWWHSTDGCYGKQSWGCG